MDDNDNIYLLNLEMICYLLTNRYDFSLYLCITLLDSEGLN